MLKRTLDWLNPTTPGGLTWRHHAAGAGLLALLVKLLFVVGILGGGAAIAHHYLARGGYDRRHEIKAPPFRAAGGAPLPASWSLDRYVVRLHNQGTSNSCVGQTLSTITEIEAAERGIHVPLSAGFIWNLATGGSGSPTTFGAAYAILTNDGDAPLRAFPPDGATEYWVLPDRAAYAAAWRYHATYWRSIGIADRYSIEVELRAGHPLAFAAPWYDSWLNNTSASMPWPAGNFDFWHVTAIIGYSPAGVTILNSWGPGWGQNARAVVPWSMLVATGGSIAVSDTALPWPAPKPTPTPTPRPRPKSPSCKSYSKTLGVNACWHGKPSWELSIWLKHRKLGKALDRGTWHTGRPGYTRYRFRTGIVYAWPSTHRYKIAWKR